MPVTFSNRTAIVTGVGPGTGSALVARFAAAGYRVAMIARSAEIMGRLSETHEGARGYRCNVRDADSLLETCAQIKNDMGAASVVVHNAVAGGAGSFLEIKPELLMRNFEVNTMALLHLARATAPDMIAAGEGAIVATGNTMAYRGKSVFAGTAPTKAAQRILMESIARELGPKGVHGAYVAIDAAIDVPWTRERWPEKPDDFYCQPADIAEECYRIAHQARSAWVFDAVIRPFGETW